MAIDDARRVAVVTGGSSGLGRGSAERLLAEGYRVAILDIRTPSEWKGNANLSIHIGDVSDIDFVRSAADSIAAEWGAVTSLVNSAGIFPRAPAASMDLTEWHRVLSVNLAGTFICSQVFGALMHETGGSIVNTAAGQAFRPKANGAAYAASKGGIVSLTRALAIEWAPKVRVNCVVPGLADTAMPRLARSEESMAEAGKRNPMRRIGRPEDTAAAVFFLLSEDAAHITGQTLGVNGGSVML